MAMCFPGDAAAQVLGRGDVRLSDLKTGDLVLDKSGMHVRVLGFLHAIRSQSNEFLTVVHSLGEFLASANHLVFANEEDVLVADVQVGDLLSVADGKSMVLSVRQSVGSQGMFAPLTASGTIAVDGVLASSYAAPSTTLRLPHGMAHAVAFPTRMFHGLQSSVGYRQMETDFDQAILDQPVKRAMLGPLSALQSWLMAY